MRTAAELKYGEKGIISEVDPTHPSSKTILEHGFIPGQTIELMCKSIFNDPIPVLDRGTLSSGQDAVSSG